jgi:poly(3-hydroxybutyrate) depolymerase
MTYKRALMACKPSSVCDTVLTYFRYAPLRFSPANAFRHIIAAYKAVVLLAFFSFALALTGCATIRPDMLAKGATAEKVVLPDGSTVQYMQYVPASYHGGKAPVIVFLHGSGEAGSDVTRVMGPGPWEYARDHADFPFIILAPQQWRDEEW